MKSSSKVLAASIAVLAVIALAIVAVYAGSTNSGANATSDRPDHFNWVGAVADNNHKALGNVTVTLHLMTSSGEACNLTNRTSAGSPFPGTYAFYDVPRPDDVTYAYATADSGDLGDGVHCYGRTDNIEINKSDITSGIIVLDIPEPDGITPADNGIGTRTLEYWYGAVVDSLSRPLSNVSVTLHLMSPDGEAAVITTLTNSTVPYSGGFAFENIALPDNATYAYVMADLGDMGNGTHQTTRSKDFALDKSQFHVGFLIF
jgi:hypothetical protein